ncbi:MAG TPA: hypothetical protein VFN09_03795 [Rhodanobacteraceae bacterium]|nr:hypothetical protein [Rhodanobacteraceae bacterium]
MHAPRNRAITAALLLGAALTAPASAAVKISDAFDGSYYNPATSGRGLFMDVAARANGDKYVFMGQFTFDAAGKPVWLAYAGTLPEHAHEGRLDVWRMDGGSFGFPFTKPQQTVIGSASIRFDSCDRVQLDVDMMEGTAFPDTQFADLRPIAGPSPHCVYRQSFSACPDFATAVPGLERACALSGVYRQDIVLTNDTTWVLNGLVRIGDDNANSASLTIEPGTVLVGGSGGTPYLYVSPGSRILANGKPWAPIVLTSVHDGFGGESLPSPGDLGGLVVSGNAPANACPQAPFQCYSEFDQTQRFGGDDPFDSSGSITYFQVRYAGIEFQPDSEVNAFTFQGVGSGTRVDHIQAYRGADDGVEFFGGTVNVRHLVVTEGGDDAVDWDLGYSGKLQYGLVVHGAGLGEDHGFEGASNGDNFDATPRATPTLANFTLLGHGNGGSGIVLKEGSAGRIVNSVVAGFPESCIAMEDLATYTAAGTPSAPSGATEFRGVIADCGVPFLDADNAPYTAKALFDAASGNTLGDAGLVGYQPGEGAAARHGGQAVEDGFLERTAFRGAFDGLSDWTAGWTHRAGGSH